MSRIGCAVGSDWLVCLEGNWGTHSHWNLCLFCLAIDLKLCVYVATVSNGSQAMALVLEHSLLYEKQPGNFNLQDFVTSAARKLAVPTANFRMLSHVTVVIVSGIKTSQSHTILNSCCITF